MSTASREDPVTLVIPLRDTVEQARALLESIAKHTTSVPFQVLIVDRASHNAAQVEQLAMRSHVRILRQPQDLGYAAAVNIAAQRVATSLLCTLHPGLRVTRGWLDRMLYHLQNTERVGLVAPSFNDARSAQRMDLGAGRTEQELEENALHLSGKFERRMEDVAFVESTCVLIRTAVFHELGRFAEEFSLSSHWDADFCRRARRLGLRIVIARDAVVYSPSLPSDELNQVEIVRNRLLLKQRWLEDPFFRGIEAAARNDHASAIALFEADLARVPQRPDTLIKLALSLQATTQFDAALHCIDRYLVLCPRSKDGLFVRAQILVGINRTDESMAMLEEVERTYYVEVGERRELLHTMASLHRLAKRPARALEYLQRALDLGQSTPELYMTLIETAAETGEPSLFAGALESLVDADPKNVKLRLELGAALKVAGNVDGARRAYHHVMKLDPTCEEAARQLKLLEGPS